MPHNIKDLLKMMVEKSASDLHITAGSMVHLRIDEDLVPVGQETLSEQDSRTLIFSMLTDRAGIKNNNISARLTVLLRTRRIAIPHIFKPLKSDYHSNA